MLGLEHVAHQVVHDPVIARRLGVQLRGSPCNFAKGPLARASIQLKLISRHHIPLVDAVYCCYPQPPGPKQSRTRPRRTRRTRDEDVPQVIIPPVYEVQTCWSWPMTPLYSAGVVPRLCLYQMTRIRALATLTVDVPLRRRKRPRRRGGGRWP